MLPQRPICVPVRGVIGCVCGPIDIKQTDFSQQFGSKSRKKATNDGLRLELAQVFAN